MAKNRGSRPSYRPTKRARRTRGRARVRRPVSRRKRKLPRYALKRGLQAPPNTYPFMRAHTSYVNIGESRPDLHIHINPSAAGQNTGSYMILKLHTAFNMLPGCKDVALPGTSLVAQNDFMQLFQQYKITSVKTTLTPNFSAAAAPVGTHTSNTSLPNYEMFILKSNIVDEDEMELKDMQDQQIEAWLSSKNTKGRRILPSRTQVFNCTSPKVVKFGTAMFKKSETGFHTMHMGAPEWYSTSPAHDHDHGGIDETGIKHYTYDIVIRRVDGEPLQPEDSDSVGRLGFRMETRVGWLCRSTPKDIFQSTTATA